jgi:hypothetical protein
MKNKLMVKRFVDEVNNQRNYANVDEFIHEDVAIRFNDTPPLVGMNAYQTQMEVFQKAFPDLQFTTLLVLAEDEHVVSHWKVEGTNQNSFAGIPATNKKVELQGLTLLQMKEEKIASLQISFNEAEILKQIGAALQPNQ